MEYRVFTMECDSGTRQVINDYILNDEGSLEAALASTKFVVRRTEEIKNMIEWMKKMILLCYGRTIYMFLILMRSIYMGKRLKDKYEDEYYSIGFEFSR